jgi:hypothetical protein
MVIGGVKIGKIFVPVDCNRFRVSRGEIKDGMDFEVWGVVVHVIHSV